jgi:DNA (cytosine-5)-methyltransferase 1
MNLTALGVHIYSGAFSLGMSDFFQILGQFEEGPWGYDTFELNFPGLDHPTSRYKWNLEPYRNRVNAVYANPPCACWSAVGSGLGVRDPRFQFTRNAADLALELRPDFFVVESVCRAWSIGKEAYKGIAEQFEREGYAITFLLTNALLHGAPQFRERFHLIAHRYQLPFVVPTIPDPLPSVRKALGGLGPVTWLGEGVPQIPNHAVKRPSAYHLMVYDELKPGEKYNNAVDRLTARGIPPKRGRLLAGRSHADFPSRTMVDLRCVVHPTENRLISLREGARLCGYPDNFIFAFDPTDRTFDAKPTDVTQVVLPTMGRYLGKLFATAMESEAPAKGSDLIDWRPLAKNFSPGRCQKRSLVEV